MERGRVQWGMTTPRKSTLQPAGGQASRDAIHDQRTQLVKQMLQQESAERDARTIKLRALRLAREAEEAASIAAAPVAVKPAAKRKR